ncbi:MAG: lipoyl(octanoyl) transferase LipB [Deltaproteobacteria bacterium]|nr:lipoyl(octanoyl) transferase LipB [Deltaproteobacteria bacterium]MBW2118408.1 lipoyl(octanoyl) transferase LipB [Deltaproteobacteria bacterium]MBW2343429.1 lipoyl(octanoyl) transferase LipB [Deltaproteobacteria bacterium]
MTTHKNNPETQLKQNQWLLVELPAMEYTKAWDLQNRLVGARKDGMIDKDIVLLLEHPPVFTLGRRGGLENLTVSEDFLKKAGIPVIHVERGGDITFHGPGQIVMYPIIDLRAARLGVIDYVGLLEEVMIRTAADWGIEAGRNPLNRGVWVGNNKLGSIGIAIRRGISFHGMAFNVNLSLEPFGWINPCGLHNIGITSMEKELSRKLSMDKVCEAIKRHVEAVFSVELVMTDLTQILSP